MRSTRDSLMAVAMIAAMGAGHDLPGPALRSFASRYRPAPPRQDTEMAREIAEHNREVDRRKAEKRAAKLARRMA